MLNCSPDSSGNSRELLIQEWIRRLCNEGIPHSWRLLYSRVFSHPRTSFVDACIELNISSELWNSLLRDVIFKGVVDTAERTWRPDFWNVPNIKTDTLTSWVKEIANRIKSWYWDVANPLSLVKPVWLSGGKVKTKEEIKKRVLDILLSWIKLERKFFSEMSITPFWFWMILREDKEGIEFKKLVKEGKLEFYNDFRKAYKDWLKKRWNAFVVMEHVKAWIEWLCDVHDPVFNIFAEELFNKDVVIIEPIGTTDIKLKIEKSTQVEPFLWKVVKKTEKKNPQKFTYKNTNDEYYELKCEIIKKMIEENLVRLGQLKPAKKYERIHVFMHQDKEFRDIINAVIVENKAK